MRRLNGKITAGLVLASCVCGASSGCAENESTLFIVGVKAPESDCTYSTSVTGSFLARGWYDLGFNSSYQGTILLGNQMASRGDKDRSRTETSRIVLEGAEITLLLPDGSQLRDTFSTPGAGFVDVSTGADPGYGILSVVLIPSLAGADQATQDQAAAVLKAGYVIAEIRAFGKTLGGQAVESSRFRFPIEVCDGCLVTFSGEGVSGNPKDGFSCSASAASTTTGSGACVWGQDVTVPCQSCAGTFEVCQTRAGTGP
jgi:hypothetical protein